MANWSREKFSRLLRKMPFKRQSAQRRRRRLIPRRRACRAFVFQGQDAIEHCVGLRRTTRNVDGHRHDTFAAEDDAVALTITIVTVRAATHRNDVAMARASGRRLCVESELLLSPGRRPFGRASAAERVFFGFRRINGRVQTLYPHCSNLGRGGADARSNVTVRFEPGIS
jgi:hypothetical protein